MSVIQSVQPILNSKTAKVVMEISANSANPEEMVVVLKPVSGPIPDNAPEALKQLVAALSTPLKVIAKPECIEAEVEAQILQRRPHITSWAERAALLEAKIQTASETPVSKSSPLPQSAAEPAPTESAEALNSDDDLSSL